MGLIRFWIATDFLDLDAEGMQAFITGILKSVSHGPATINLDNTSEYSSFDRVLPLTFAQFPRPLSQYNSCRPAESITDKELSRTRRGTFFFPPWNITAPRILFPFRNFFNPPSSSKNASITSYKMMALQS